MSASFILELYYEHDDDRQFVECEASKLVALVDRLAPHIALDVWPLKATAIYRSRFLYRGTWYEVPNQNPSRPGRQSLLITSEDIGAPGWAGPMKGCLSKQALEHKKTTGADSADILIHEWLHTISGLAIDGRVIPDPDTNAEFGFSTPSGRSVDGDDTWHDWYKYALHSR